MKKEIGSIFPLSGETISSAEKEQIPFSEERIFYSLCREALHDIALSLKDTNKRVLIPAYTCQTVITPFEEAGWECKYYSIQKSLRIDTNHLSELAEKYQPSLIVTHPYFGMDLNQEEIVILKRLHDDGVKIILDLTQCIFSTCDTSFASYVVASYRKWFPIPDGGFLKRSELTKKILQPEQENLYFTERELAAMYLRDQYFGNGEQRTKDISIRLSKAADHLAENNILSHKMSQIAYTLLQKEDKEWNQQARKENFIYLFDHISDSNKITKVCNSLDNLTTAPLYFTIYAKNRIELQRKLAQNAIYAPVIWPMEDSRVFINDEIKYIYEHLLALPCDQRYDTTDIKRIVDIINNY